MARNLVQAGVTIDVATTDDDGPGKRTTVPLGQKVVSDVYHTLFFPKQTEFYKVSLPMRSWLKEHLPDYDLVHVHALFSYTSNCAARLAHSGRIPYIVRPLGVLNRWGIQHRRSTLKALSLRFVERPILRHAAAMHYTSDAERTDAEQAGACAPGFVIPLGIDLRPLGPLPGPERFFERWPDTRGREVVLFLGRLAPIKGLDRLLDAFSTLKEKHSRAILVLAGEGDPKFTDELRRQSTALGLDGTVVWTGHLAGEEKLAALRASTVLLLPSESESFGLAAAEALGCGVPVIATKGTPWQELQTNRCGWWVEMGVEPLASAMREALSMSDDERREMGRRGRELIESKYTWPRIAEQMKAMYQSILH
jgi:glycosyltransferase involved in cell wall biosynthesis